MCVNMNQTINIENSGQADYLINVIQQLSLAHDLDTVMTIVRQAARSLTGADGATFVLRDRDMCYYADEDAIEPLWKGHRFPMASCISGWVMLNRQPVVIRDIYQDPRIPAAAYRPTFVKSLAMVPIRTEEPVGAIGNYWADHYEAGPEQLKLLQALANSASIAIENVQLYNELEQRVRDRTAQLEVANRELEAFSYSVSHDLRSPLRAISGFSQALAESLTTGISPDTQRYLDRITTATSRMNQLIEDLLNLSRVARSELVRQECDLGEIAGAIITELQNRVPAHKVRVRMVDGIKVHADTRLLHVVLDNLLRNAWKFTGRQTAPEVEVGVQEQGGQTVYFVRDNGAGFNMNYADKLFRPFQRLHNESEFPGTGVGLATVQRIIHRHGGRIWPESAPGEGTTFYFTLAST